MFLFSLSNSHNLINKSEDCSTYLIWIGQIRDFWLSIKILVKDVHSCLHNHKKIETFKALANTYTKYQTIFNHTDKLQILSEVHNIWKYPTF